MIPSLEQRLEWPCSKCGAPAHEHLSVFMARSKLGAYSIDDADIVDHAWKPAPTAEAA